MIEGRRCNRMFRLAMAPRPTSAAEVNHRQDTVSSEPFAQTIRASFFPLFTWCHFSFIQEARHTEQEQAQHPDEDLLYGLLHSNDDPPPQ